MDDLRRQAHELLSEFKGERYLYGWGLPAEAAGLTAARFGRRVLFVGRLSSGWFQPLRGRVLDSLKEAGLAVTGEVLSAAPNSPVSDVFRLCEAMKALQPEVVVVADGGSGIDAVKAAAVLYSLEETELDPFFGVGRVAEACRRKGRAIIPVIPLMTTASSASHLTKGSNVTDPEAGQKKLIIDEAIVPPASLFDYADTASQPRDLTLDGGLDGIAHCLEVYYGAQGALEERARRIAETGIDLVIRGLLAYSEDPLSREARVLLGLGTDLGGYAVMTGGTSGAHLNSFSLVDVLSHGRACGLMNPYYSCFFAPAIEEKLRLVGRIYRRYGLVTADLEALSGYDLGEAVAEGMLKLSRALGLPTRLSDVPGLTAGHLARCLKAAKDPQLAMKLQAMPVPLDAGMIDETMGPLLEAAWHGDLAMIRGILPARGYAQGSRR